MSTLQPPPGLSQAKIDFIKGFYAISDDSSDLEGVSPVSLEMTVLVLTPKELVYRLVHSRVGYLGAILFRDRIGSQRT
jgi:hypothetical protein